LKTLPATSAVFDVCHVGVVLRALLFVHGVLAVVLLFSNNEWGNWLMQLAAGASVVLPAVLMWLLAVCVGKTWWSALPLQGQRVAAAALGAVCALLSSIPGWMLTQTAPSLINLLAPALAGAALAAVMFQWLRLRAKATLPAQTTARLAELQSRIRPHFLFNTLNTALALVRSDPARAEGVLEDLSELFRVAISDRAEFATLADEIALAQRYLAIEQIRFGARLKVDWQLDPAANLARMPPLLLQPLLENAVRHGIEPAEAGGRIEVHTHVKLGQAVVSIINSVPATASKPGHGMALGNVRERLLLMHDVAAQFEAGLSHEPDDSRLFKVLMVVPL
jgi:two-component system, LytTR family, sensor histidine kinase AlgZ